MGSTLETVVFYFLAAFIIAMSIMTVTTQRIVRSATYLLFVLFGTAGIYFLLGYTFLGSVQIMVYAGGIVVLYVFSILLTSGEGDRAEKLKRSRLLAGLFTMIAGLGIILFITLKHNFLQTGNLAPQEINIHAIGNALLSSDKYGYILPFGIKSRNNRNTDDQFCLPTVGYPECILQHSEIIMTCIFFMLFRIHMLNIH